MGHWIGCEVGVPGGHDGDDEQSPCDPLMPPDSLFHASAPSSSPVPGDAERPEHDPDLYPCPGFLDDTCPTCAWVDAERIAADSTTRTEQSE